MSRKRLSSEDRELRNAEIIALYEDKVPAARIALLCDVNERTVSRVTEHLRPPNPGAVRYSAEKWAEVERWLTEEEGSFVEAARTFGMHESSISRRFPHLGWRREQAGHIQGELNRIQHRLRKVTYANS